MDNDFTETRRESRRPTHSFARRGLACLFIVATTLVGGCTKVTGVHNVERPATGTAEEFDLAIVGFSHTNREIGSFSVDGVGGGNLVFSPTGGGGGTITCCVRYRRGESSKYVVRWDTHACRYDEKPPSEWGERFSLYDYFSEKQVEAKDKSDTSPGYFEVHFFQDGTVKAQITSEISAPMVTLPNDRKEQLSPQCPGNVMPASSD